MRCLPYLLAAICLPAALATAEESVESLHGNLVGRAVHLVIPKDKLSIHGFSTKTGQWSHLELEQELPKETVRFISDQLAIVQTPQAIYAFGTETGSWKVLKLNERGSTAVVSGKNISVTDGRVLHLISPASRYWEGVDLDTGVVHSPSGVTPLVDTE